MTGHIRIGGVWKDIDSMSAKVGGTWKDVDKGFTKVGGVWKEYYTAFTPLSVTGGNSTIDLNGYRHHIFTSSGTLSVSAGSPADLYVLVINGGKSGSNGVRTGTLQVSSGSGGQGNTNTAASPYKFINGISGGASLTVAVGAANANSSITGLPATADSTLSMGYGDQGYGGTIYSQGYTAWPTLANSATQGYGSVSLTSTIFKDVLGTSANSIAGGGGAGRAYMTTNFGANAGTGPTGSIAFGGTGGSAGGNYTNVYANPGSPGSTNRGGGGGGGAAALAYSSSTYTVTSQATGSGASGGSGVVIISYPLSAVGL